MSGSLSVQPGSLRNYSQQHGDVATAVSQVSSSTPDISTVSATYGHIASSVSTALGDVVDARGGALTSTVSKAQQLADGLRSAAGLYEKSDEDGASAVHAAAGQPGSQQSGTGSASGTESSGASDSASKAGEMVSALAQQVGEQVGKLAETAGQALAGLAEIPAQALEGVQGIVEAAVGASGDATAVGADAAAAADPAAGEPTGPPSGPPAPQPTDTGSEAPATPV